MVQIKYSINKLTAKIRNVCMRLRKILSILLAFSIFFMFVGITVLTSLKWNFSRNTMYRVLDSSNYYSNLLQEIDSAAKVITMPTGLPMEVLDGVFRLKEVREDINLQLDKAYKSGEFNPNLEIIKTRLKNKVVQCLEEKEVIPDKELSGYIDEYINSIAHVYRNSLKLPLLDYFIRLIVANQMFYIIAMVILISVTLIAMIILYKLNPALRSFLFYAYNSTLATAIMLAVLSQLLISDKLYTGLHLAPNSLSGFIIDYLMINFRSLISISALFLFLSLALLFSIRVARTKL